MNNLVNLNVFKIRRDTKRLAETIEEGSYGEAILLAKQNKNTLDRMLCNGR